MAGKRGRPRKELNELRRAEGYTIAGEYEDARRALEEVRARRQEWCRAARREGASLAVCGEILGVSTATVQAILAE